MVEVEAAWVEVVVGARNPENEDADPNRQKTIEVRSRGRRSLGMIHRLHSVTLFANLLSVS
jgi:hypothetical protein